MASILKVDELQGIVSAGDITVTSEGGSATQSLQQGLAKHWVDYDQTVPSTNASFNTSSVSDDSAGKYTPNLTSSMSSANYGLSVTTRIENSNQGYLTGPESITASSYQGQVWRLAPTSAFSDSNFNSTAIHGDLA